jgi:hypothetical protein
MNITLPAGLTSIGVAVFANCSSLASITIPDGLTSIGNSMFDSCIGLTDITFPTRLTSIGGGAFAWCWNLRYITNLNPVPIKIEDHFVGFDKSNCELKVPSGSETAYQNADVWKEFYIMGGGLSLNINVNNYALGAVTGISSGLYPVDTAINLTAVPVEGYNFLGWISESDTLSFDLVYNFILTDNIAITAAFGNVDNYDLASAGTLKDIAGITTATYLTLTGYIDARDIAFMRDSIPNLAVLDLSGATIVEYSGTEGTTPWTNYYPANEIPVYSFYNNYTTAYSTIGKTSLTSIVLPNGVTSIGESAFNYCSNLTDITLPDELTSIGRSVFSNCSSLRDIILPAGLTSIGESHAFAYCRSLTNITIPEGVISIGYEVFASCSSLTTITLPAGLISIESGAFRDCRNLTSINIPAGVTSIKESAFYGCRSLTNITIPAGVTSIGGGAFYNCNGLTSITNLNPSPVNITSNVFEGMDKSYCELKVPSSSETAYRNADIWKEFYIEAGGLSFNVNINSGVLGTVTGTSGGLYPVNTAISLTAVPAEGYIFLGWRDGVNILSSIPFIHPKKP